jgi:DNA-binding FadR family transcriptional regulator
MDPLKGLADQVTQTTTVEESAKQLIDGFAARLAAAGTDPVKLQALQDALKQHSDALAASVAANTPADPNAPQP